MDQKIDVVIPVFNAAGHIDHTLKEMQSMSDLFNSIICVDDASTDSTASILTVQGNNIKIIVNQQNGGQHFATRIGLNHSKSEWVLTLDDDLPVAPSEIRNFITNGIQNGSSLCYASYKNQSNWIRKIGSKIVNQMMVNRFGLEGHGTSTRLIHRRLIDKINNLKDPSTFLDADLISNADKVSFVKVTAEKREVKSRYSVIKLVKMFSQMMFRQ